MTTNMTELPLPREAYDAYGPAPLRYVLVHGVGGDRTQWRALAEQLAIHGGVLAIDLPGHGAARHVGGPYRISRFAADVADIASRRAPGGAVLVGHSMGAAVCLEAARILGEAANHVIGIDALLFPELFGAHAARKSPAARVLLRTPLAAGTIDSWLERFFVAPYDEAARNTVRQTMLNTRRPALADSVASLLSWHRDEALAAITVPVSILYAASVERPRQVSELQRRCSITPFERGGHFFFMEYPAETAMAIKAADCAANSPGRTAMNRTDHDE
jgi:pimeloyl-ACP methyl ester carboxylesterase